jgi:hypothetical protein
VGGEKYGDVFVVRRCIRVETLMDDDKHYIGIIVGSKFLMWSLRITTL